jgi:hypothetical protein
MVLDVSHACWFPHVLDVLSHCLFPPSHTQPKLNKVGHKTKNNQQQELGFPYVDLVESPTFQTGTTP